MPGRHGGGESKWKGRGVANEDELAEKIAKKEQEKQLRRIAAAAEHARKLRQQRAKQAKAKAAEREFAKRVQRLGVFRALISGVGSMQVQLTFRKWVEYVEMLKDERIERYRRQRWQLNCPKDSVAKIGLIRMAPNQEMPQAYRRLDEDSVQHKMRYHIEGDEECGMDLQLKSTSLPALLPRAYRDPLYPTREDVIARRGSTALVDQLPAHPAQVVREHIDAARERQENEKRMGKSDRSSHSGSWNDMDSMTMTHSTSLTHSSSMHSNSGGRKESSGSVAAPNAHQSSSSDSAFGKSGNAVNKKIGDMMRTTGTSDGFAKSVSDAEESANRSMGTTNSSSFGTVLGAKQFVKEGTSSSQAEAAPLHQQYGYDPAIMKFKAKGLHYRTGRPVFYDAKYHLFKFVYPHVDRRFFDYGDRIRSDAIEKSYEPRGHVMVK
ncbi:unnamed protein product [Amoebophrya sp. A25]|nr:unnamed protein product [Amoebophrya sp. A25]|eukprot:GSA25T00013015001.1